jgi:hypothetical protein
MSRRHAAIGIQMATSMNKRDVITLDNGLALNKIGPGETAEYSNTYKVLDYTDLVRPLLLHLFL